MNTIQLVDELDKLKVPKNYYSINGDLRTDTYILNNIYGKWEYYYFDEKGNREDYHEFENENEACEYMLTKLKAEINYPPTSFK